MYKIRFRLEELTALPWPPNCI